MSEDHLNILVVGKQQVRQEAASCRKGGTTRKVYIGIDAYTINYTLHL